MFSALLTSKKAVAGRRKKKVRCVRPLAAGVEQQTVKKIAKAIFRSTYLRGFRGRAPRRRGGGRPQGWRQGKAFPSVAGTRHVTDSIMRILELTGSNFSTEYLMYACSGKKKGTDRPCHAHQAIRDMGGRGNVPDILNIGWYMPNL